jgi:superfamily II DNA/RNA helicase
MLNLGFKEDIEKIFKYVDKYQNKKTQNLLFSATIPEWIWKISSLYQTKNCPYIDLIKDQHVQTSKNVKHVCVESRPHDKEGFLNAIILYYLKEKNDPKVIIFCETKR